MNAVEIYIKILLNRYNLSLNIQRKSQKWSLLHSKVHQISCMKLKPFIIQCSQLFMVCAHVIRVISINLQSPTKINSFQNNQKLKSEKKTGLIKTQSLYSNVHTNNVNDERKKENNNNFPLVAIYTFIWRTQRKL